MGLPLGVGGTFRRALLPGRERNMRLLTVRTAIESATVFVLLIVIWMGFQGWYSNAKYADLIVSRTNEVQDKLDDAARRVSELSSARLADARAIESLQIKTRELASASAALTAQRDAAIRSLEAEKALLAAATATKVPDAPQVQSVVMDFSVLFADTTKAGSDLWAFGRYQIGIDLEESTQKFMDSKNNLPAEVRDLRSMSRKSRWPSWTTWRVFTQLRAGMTREQVLALLGVPRWYIEERWFYQDGQGGVVQFGPDKHLVSWSEPHS